MKHTLKTQVGILVAFSFCVLGAFALDVKADEPQLSDQNREDIGDIQQNQGGIVESRPAYERVTNAAASKQKIDPSDIRDYNFFLDYKKWNEDESANLAKDGWCVKWSENPDEITAIRCSFRPGATVTPNQLHDAAMVPSKAETDDYKTLRLREMADTWVGTVLEPHTEKLLAMLIVENGILNAERRHDCNNIYSQRLGRKLKGCFAVGIMGHNIAARGTPLVSQSAGKPWKLYDYDYAMADFEKDYPGFSFDWRIQFAEYTLRMTDCINDGNTVNNCIQKWNPREAGRIGKVERHTAIVKKALAL